MTLFIQIFSKTPETIPEVLCEKVFLEIWPYSHENTCGKQLNKVAGMRPQARNAWIFKIENNTLFHSNQFFLNKISVLIITA